MLLKLNEEIFLNWEYAYAIDLPAFKNPSDELKVYILNTEDIMYIDDMEVKFGAPQ